jgi:pyruvate kinase
MLSKEVKSKYILAATSSGNNARFISKYRPYQLIIAGTDKQETERRLCLSWGVWPIHLDFNHNRDLAEKVSEILKQQRLAKSGDLLTLVSGLNKGKIGGTSMVRIHEVD